MKEFVVSSMERSELIPITAQVQSAVRALGIADGCVTVFVPHTTAGVTINENADPDVVEDLLGALDRMAPWNAAYEHAEGNAAAHVKATLVGASVRVPVEGGRVRLGEWQGVFLCEFDGPRTRRVWVVAG